MNMSVGLYLVLRDEVHIAERKPLGDARELRCEWLFVGGRWKGIHASIGPS